MQAMLEIAQIPAVNNFKSKSSFENNGNITKERIACWRTSNSNLFGGSSSDDFTSDVSANAAAVSGMIAILSYVTG